MSPPTSPATVSGRELYALLPAVYRTRDEGGDLGLYLDALGALLDRLRATLEQRLADAFAAGPPAAMPAQSWLLPYFADLLDVRLVSPQAAGRRGEVANAIRWRQRKGTVATLQEIAKTVGGFEVEVQEGWRRVAVTPRIDLPILPAAAFGLDEPNPQNPLVAARHPGLPVATVDLRLPSRAVQTNPGHLLAHTTLFGGSEVTWRPWNPTGAPCFPDSFEDASRRTPDLRTPGPGRGAVHPRHLLLFVAPPTGFFPLPAKALESAQDVPATERLFIDRAFTGTLHVPDGRVELRRVAAEKLIVDTQDGEIPVLDAVDCLFDEIEAPNGLVRLEGTTVMKSLVCRRLQASDCLFADKVQLRPDSADEPSCVRYSRLPAREKLDAPPSLRLAQAATTTAEPIFLALERCPRQAGHLPAFGDPGYGVLDPATPEAIRTGAEDGGEMGADHHRATCLARAAVLQKLEEFLPLGIEAVLTLDPRLLVQPPKLVEPPPSAEPPRNVP